MGIYIYDFNDVLSQFEYDNVSSSDIIKLLNELSLDQVTGDNKSKPFSDNSTTFLYSGKIDTDILSSGDLASIFENSSTIDKTVAVKLLENNDFYQLVGNALYNDFKNGCLDLSLIEKGLRGDDLILYNKLLSMQGWTEVNIKDFKRIVASGFMFEPEKGAWAIVSENFVKATPPTSKIECIVPNADTGRTWGQVEIPTALENLPDSQVIGNTTVGELKALRDTKGMDSVYDSLKSYSKDFVDNTTIHWDSDGRVIGAGNSEYKYNGNSEFSTTVDDIKNFSSDTDMSTKYKDYDTLSDLEKLQTKQTELEGNKVISAVKDIPLNPSTLDKYASAVGKTVDKLDNIDLALIKIADNLTSGDGKVADALNKLSNKCVKFPSSVKKILPVVNVLGTAYEVVTTTIKAKEYYDKGDYENAARVVVDGVVTNIEGWVIMIKVA